MNFAAIAQQVERILGKDEVPSSNLGSSSIVVASFVSLATIFYALHQKSSRAHSAATPPHLEPAYGWASRWFLPEIQVGAENEIPPCGVGKGAFLR